MLEIYLKNIRGIKEKKINLDKNFNLIVGKNCSGKTSILLSIALFFGKRNTKSFFNKLFSGKNGIIKIKFQNINFLANLNEENIKITSNKNYLDFKKSYKLITLDSMSISNFANFSKLISLLVSFIGSDLRELFLNYKKSAILFKNKNINFSVFSKFKTLFYDKIKLEFDKVSTILKEKFGENLTIDVERKKLMVRELNNFVEYRNLSGFRRKQVLLRLIVALRSFLDKNLTLIWDDFDSEISNDNLKNISSDLSNLSNKDFIFLASTRDFSFFGGKYAL